MRRFSTTVSSSFDDAVGGVANGGRAKRDRVGAAGRIPLPFLSLVLAFCATMLAAPAMAADQRISASDLERFGHALVTIIEGRQTSAFARLLDVHSIGIRAAAAIADSEEHRTHYQWEFVEGQGADGITRDFFEDVTPGLSVKFIRVVERGKELSPLLRFESEDGYDYIEFLVRRSASGRDFIVDWKSLSRGVMQSELMGALAEPHVPPRLLARLIGMNSLDEPTLERLKRIDRLRASGQYAAAYSEFGKLPPAIADSRFLLNQRRWLAKTLEDNAGFARIMVRLKQLYADDPHAAVDLLDYALHQGDHATGLRLVDTIERHLGGDAFTSLLREKAYGIAGMHAEAIASAQEAIRREPDYVAAYFRLGLAFVDSGRFAAAIEVFEVLRQGLGWEFSREYFAGFEEYRALMTSPEFNAWLPEPQPHSLEP